MSQSELAPAVDRAASFKAGPDGRAQRQKKAHAETKARREQHFGRRRIGADETLDFAALVNEFQPSAILGQDREARTHHLTVWDLLLRVQRSVMIEDILSTTTGIDPVAAMRFANGTLSLLPQLLLMLTQKDEPAFHLLSANILCNLMCTPEHEHWIVAFFRANGQDCFAQLLNADTTTLPQPVYEAILATVGNICVDHAIWRDAMCAALLNPILTLTARFPSLIKDVLLTIYTMFARSPLPANELAEQTWPLILHTLQTAQPLSDNSEDAARASPALLTLRQWARYGNADYRRIIVGAPGIVQQMASWLRSESVHGFVKEAAASVLQHLPQDAELQPALCEQNVIPALIHGLLSPNVQTRIYCSVGLEHFAQTASAASLISTNDGMRALVQQAAGGTNAGRKAAVCVLNALLPHLNGPLLKSWLDNGIMEGLKSNFQLFLYGDEETMIGFVKGLDHIFRDASFGRKAVARFEEIDGDNALASVFGSSSTPILSQYSARLLDVYFGDTMCEDVD